LPQKDEISSTEKLLDLIRKKDDSPPSSADKNSADAAPPPSRRFFSDVIPIRKRITVGVDIGYNDLKLGMVNQISDKKFELLDFIKIRYPKGVNQNSPKFPDFLKAALKDFCGRGRNISIWSAISSAKVETRSLKIPRVSKKQVDNAIYWTLKKDVAFDESEMIFDFEALGEIVEDGVNKIEVMAYVAPRQDVVQMRNLFAKIGFPLTGVSIIPFGIQNLLRTQIVESGGGNICHLFIGRDWSRIVIYAGSNLSLSRGIKAGVKSMIEAVAQAISKAETREGEQSINPSESSIFGIDDESYMLDLEQARRIFFQHITSDDALRLGDTNRILTPKDVFSMIQPALDRLIKQVERTLQHYNLHINPDRIERIYVSGSMSEYKLLLEYMREQLDISIDILDPFSPRLSYLGVAPLPEKASRKEAFAPAIGMALSRHTLTPNFIYTYKDKESAEKARRTNRIAAFAILIFVAFCYGLYAWGNAVIDGRKIQLARLKAEARAFQPQVNKELIVSLATQTKEKRSALKQLGDKYKGMAVINELTALTPPEIRLVRITANLGEAGPSKASGPKQMLSLEGVVLGDRLTFESLLAGYIVELKSSPLFKTTRIGDKSFQFVDRQEVLVFSATLELV